MLVFLACADTLYSQTVTWQRQPSWDAAEMFSDHLLKVEQSGKMALADFDGVVVLSCNNNARVTEIHEEVFLVIDENNKLLSLGDPSGRVVQIGGEWFVDEAWPYFTNGLLAVRNSQNLWGYIDKSGKVVIKERYKNAFPFFFGYASVCENDKKGWHIINTEGACVTVTDGAIRQKDFSFASSFTKIDERRLLAMVLISDKVYFIDVYGKITGGIVSVEGATVSGLKSGNRFECIEGDSFVEIEVDAVVEIASIKKGNIDYQCYKSSVEAKLLPQIRGIDIENDGTIKVGEMVICSQFQEAIVLSSERVLVKKDGSWSLLKFDLDDPLVEVILGEASTHKICHNAPMCFQLKGKRENVKAYAIDNAGNMTFWDIDPATGSFYVPIHHFNENMEAVATVGLSIDEVLLEPTVFTKRVSLGEGFRVSGPTEVTVTKSGGKASFELTVSNNSEQDAAPFDVSIDNGTDLHFEGLPARQSIRIPVNKTVSIPALEDYAIKLIKVRISEKGMPEKTYKVTIKFVKPSIKG